MTTGILFGKGPSFDPTLIAHHDHSFVACVNESVRHVCGPRTLVVCDRRVAEDMAEHLAATGAGPHVSVYCRTRDTHLFNGRGANGFLDCNNDPDWATMSREHAHEYRLCYCAGFTSTAALWWLWLHGCNRVILSGVGDPGASYHSLFHGRPGTEREGENALFWLEKLANAKGIQLVRGDNL